MTDLIDRQAAIDAIHNADTQIYEGEAAVGRRNYMTKEECCEIIDSLPSAQPEIIYCKDCTNWDTTWTNDWTPNYHYCPIIDGVRKDDFYCADAERRTDE